MSSTGRDRLLVLGGGVIGLSVANYLLDLGYEVTLLDRHEPGSGVSYGNAGLIANFATLPAASRTSVARLPKQLLRHDSGISVRTDYWPKMLPFARQFLRFAQPSAYARNREVLAALIAQGCRELLHAADSFGVRPLIAQRGALLVYESRNAWAQVQDHEVPERRDLGVTCQVLTKREVHDLEPALENLPVAGGILYPDTAHVLDPGAWCRRLFERFLGQGGRFERVSLQAIDLVSGGGVRVYSTVGTSYFGHKAIVALGAKARELLRASQWRAPLVSERGYHVEMEPTERGPIRPVGWGDHHFFLTPMADGLRAAGTTEFAHPDARPDDTRYRLLERWTERLLGTPLRVRSQWVGSRATTPDGLPVIGTLPNCQDLILATGHGHVGLTLSALTGRLIADLLSGKQAREPATSLSPSRFRP